MYLENNDNLSAKDKLNLNTQRDLNIRQTSQQKYSNLCYLLLKISTNQDKSKFHHNLQKKQKYLSNYIDIFNQEMLIFYWVKHAKGTVFIRTSQNFISSFLNSQRSSKNTEISLGNNLDKIQTLNAKDIVIGADFNKEMHLMKICQYKFTHSKNLSNHPIAKQFVSLKIYIYNLDKFIQIFRSSAQEKSFEKEQIREFNLNFANLVIQSQHIRKQTTVQDVNQDKS
ncbi:unnamed protein product [Paramecium sonneborni]|uniref:Uncharacterized protein n=1 Tax=Paramecium sonneborni TaxID=65129 RepID=A0A8S1QZ33_9CILI|nr:unnamed protein product [Paramecium sonneborni]